MDLVEKAAERLAQLQKAGVEIPVPQMPGTQPQAASTAELTPTPERLAQSLERFQATEAPPIVPKATPVATSAPLLPSGRASVTTTGSRSKVVQIDLDALAAAGFVTPQAQRSQIADEFRVIKRPIIRNAHERIGARADRANLIMVTSAIPAEGKSFLALNLAMSIALEVDSHALLVDADVANPSLMHLTHLPPASKGLLDLLDNGETKLHDVLLRTNVEKLTLLPAGTAHGRATEMLASETMANLLEDMASRYSDRILIF